MVDILLIIQINISNNIICYVMHMPMPLNISGCMENYCIVTTKPSQKK